jgi:hypothetical protein
VQTSDLLLQVSWDEVIAPYNGGDEITSYNLQYDDGSNGQTWTNLCGYPYDEISLSHSVTDNIVKGVTYKFRVRAKNAQGWGSFSDVLDLVAARRPDQIDPVITSNEYDMVRITWSEPAFDGGSPLLGFRIRVQTA